MSKSIQRISVFFKENSFLMTIFFISLIFFIVQRITGLKYDFLAYLQIGEYFFHGGRWFALYRAPLTSFILGLLLFFGREFARFAYVVLISTFFLFSNIKLADSLYKKINPSNFSKSEFRFLFYFFSMSPLVLKKGLVFGSELLYLSFIELFLANFFSERISGHFFGLAFLTRYNAIIFSPFLIYEKKPKRIFLNLLGFFTITLPWFLLNYLYFGNPLASFLSSYNINIQGMARFAQPFNLNHLLFSINWFLPFFLIGVFISLRKIEKNRDFKNPFMIFFFIMLLNLYEVWRIPLKPLRYCFPLSLSIAFFSLHGFLEVFKNFKKRKQIYTLFIMFFLISFVILLKAEVYRNLHDKRILTSIAQDIKNLHLTNCSVVAASPIGVDRLNYLSGNVKKEFINFGRSSSLRFLDSISENEVLVVRKREFKNYSNILKEFEVLSSRERYVFLVRPNFSRRNCKKPTTKPIKNKNWCSVLGGIFKGVRLDQKAEAFCKKIQIEPIIKSKNPMQFF